MFSSSSVARQNLKHRTAMQATEARENSLLPDLSRLFMKK